MSSLTAGAVGIGGWHAACGVLVANAIKSPAPGLALSLRGPLGLKGWALGRLRLKWLKTGPGRF